MKKNVSILMAVCLSACFLMLNSCASNPKKDEIVTYSPVEIEGVYSESGNLVFTNLPHLELVSLLCRIAGLPEFTGNYNGGSQYLEQMETLLGKYKDFPIIQKIQNLNGNKGVSGEAFISLAYHIKPDFSGTTVSLSPKPETLHYNWNDIPDSEINQFIKELHDFAIESNFARIYVLNKGSFVNDTLKIQEDLKEYIFDEWLSDFFTGTNPKKVFINISMANVGYSYYDFALDENNNRNFYITIYPGANLIDFAGCYCKLYAQIYASENWNSVKEPFTKYFKKVLLRTVGDDKELQKEVESLEVTDFYLASIVSQMLIPFYLNDALIKAEDYYGSLDENRSIIVKHYGEEVGNGWFDLFQEYIDNRNVYPDFKSFYPKLNEFVSNLPQD